MTRTTRSGHQVLSAPLSSPRVRLNWPVVLMGIAVVVGVAMCDREIECARGYECGAGVRP